MIVPKDIYLGPSWTDQKNQPVTRSVGEEYNAITQAVGWLGEEEAAHQLSLHNEAADLAEYLDVPLATLNDAEEITD